MLHQLYVVEPPGLAPHLSLKGLLTSENGYNCHHNEWSSFSLSELANLQSQLLLAVAVPETAEAIRFLHLLAAERRRIPTLAVVPNEPSAELLRMAAEAADDFMFWPVRRHELEQRVNRLLGATRPDLQAAQRTLTSELGMAQVVGAAPQFLEVINRIVRMGPSNASVLLSGETGTGKEVCARSIHLLSRRSQGPFIPVECSAIPEHLAESELFGHVRGAFTDAHRDHKGLVSLAEDGTLFLDEIDTLSLPTQAKLLRFIQEGTYRPIGGEHFCRANVRVIAASNCSLEQCVSEKRFRGDLFFRLNVLRIELPPLRERPGDVRLLAQYFLLRLAEEDGTSPKQLSPAALCRLENYSWPGNIRELYNLIQRAVVLAPGIQILPGHVGFSTESSGAIHTAANFRNARSMAIATFERQYVHELLQRHDGNITRAARDAGQDRRAFGRLAKKYKTA